MKDRTIGQKARRVLEALANKDKAEVAVRALQSDREAVAFGKEITDALNASGISANFSATEFMRATNTGVGFVVKDFANRPSFSDFILFAFRQDGISLS